MLGDTPGAAAHIAQSCCEGCLWRDDTDVSAIRAAVGYGLARPRRGHEAERWLWHALGLSRRVADLEGAEHVRAGHVGEAIQGRILDRDERR